MKQKQEIDLKSCVSYVFLVQNSSRLRRNNRRRKEEFENDFRLVLRKIQRIACPYFQREKNSCICCLMVDHVYLNFKTLSRPSLHAIMREVVVVNLADNATISEKVPEFNFLFVMSGKILVSKKENISFPKSVLGFNLLITASSREIRGWWIYIKLGWSIDYRPFPFYYLRYVCKINGWWTIASAHSEAVLVFRQNYISSMTWIYKGWAWIN